MFLISLYFCVYCTKMQRKVRCIEERNRVAKGKKERRQPPSLPSLSGKILIALAVDGLFGLQVEGVVGVGHEALLVGLDGQGEGLEVRLSEAAVPQGPQGDFKVAIFCLALSGLCDMFDGKIARSKKNRTDDEKLYGVQIDSLCDVVCFGVFPALICFLIGVRGPIGIFIVGYYCVCSVIRLAFFNVLETRRQHVF